jgi:LytTr DNA-binding domain
VTNPVVLVMKRALPEGWLRPGGGLLISQWTLWLGFSLLAALINAISGVADIMRSGDSTPAWHEYVYELTSWFGFAIVVPALFLLDNALATRKVALPGRLLIYAAFSVVFSAVHIFLMVGARPPVFALFGDHYGIGSWLDRFTYEYPKDIVTYLIALGVAALQRRSVAAETPVDVPAGAPVGATATAPNFLARGATGETLIRVAEIDWVEAQGNYVALHMAGGAYLVRRTLQEVEAALTGFGFIRTHRSAIVRSSLIRGLASAADGGLFVSLDNGERVPLSRGRKQNVKAALSG